MSIQVCIFLCVLMICITVLVLQIVEKYPQWCSYYEYRQKAEEYNKVKEDYHNDIKDVVSVISDLQHYFDKDNNNAYNLLQVIIEIKIALKEKSSINAIDSINSILERNKL